ncbi:pyridoxamine 5'-phosphate oxidase family protein [Sphingosinicella sp. CPCC 101087]|uniref:pyridoxamine 5'-phosphate oxidase family protein n=1 Tax=Sphingosinicella sp. CPCC 101087 TaxID=2497754 RepID=UPI00101D8792|nr:pyridoxamine 5'-phosphate oxidase family protein [Sphingosinicella sp. CPCC 101087]
MPNEAALEARFWRAIADDMTVMLGLADRAERRAQPMTAQLGGREGRGPIWFFTSTEADLVRDLGPGAPALLHFAAKGHELFASIEGRLVPDDDPATIDRLWNRFVAAWFEEGRDDPKLKLLRFDPESAQIWLNENSLFAGVKMLLGADPKKDYADKVAEVEMDGR